MREHLFNKTLPHMANAAGTHWRHGQMAKSPSPLSAELFGEVFHPDHRGQLSHRESAKLPGENIEDHDIISAIQQAHEETVALWLAGSWRCNLGANDWNAPRQNAVDGSQRGRCS
ncbi:hypothetical protein PMI15_04569 [Polaromonas sp. CF318]|nr:hypothetical protein PMI15_04569 [Polaromonas sp. CF318]